MDKSMEVETIARDKSCNKNDCKAQKYKRKLHSFFQINKITRAFSKEWNGDHVTSFPERERMHTKEN